MNLPNSFGVLPSGSLHWRDNRFLMSGACKDWTISWLSLIQISPGVLAAASKPNNPMTSKSGKPCSATVGISRAPGDLR